jgi:hypothetical protein
MWLLTEDEVESVRWYRLASNKNKEIKYDILVQKTDDTIQKLQPLTQLILNHVIASDHLLLLSNSVSLNLIDSDDIVILCMKRLVD